MAGAVQQTGFRRVKRVGAARDKRPSPWASLRAALDEDAARQQEEEQQRQQNWEADSHVVHDENYFNRLQHSANHR